MLGGSFYVNIDNNNRLLDITKNSEFHFCINSDPMSEPVISETMQNCDNISFVEEKRDGNVFYIMKATETIKYIDQFLDMKPIPNSDSNGTYSKNYSIRWIEEIDTKPKKERTKEKSYRDEEYIIYYKEMKFSFFDFEVEEVISVHLNRWKKIRHHQVNEVKRLFSLSQQSFDVNNRDHEDLLFNLWEIAFNTPNEKSRVSEKWKSIGFQSNDPSKDFRGMGILGLKNLIYIMLTYNDNCQRILSSDREYPFASLGINISNMVFSFLNVNHKLINVPPTSNNWTSDIFNFMCYCRMTWPQPLVNERDLQKFSDFVFNEVYCQTFFVFDKLWDSMKATYMDTPNVLFSTQNRMKSIFSKRPMSVEQLKAWTKQELLSIKE